MTVGICTDSHAQLPPELVARFGVAVVPITVRIGECEYLEGVDLSVDEFYARLASEGHAIVTTSHPSPGQFALAYDELAERGCTQILSIHSSADAAGTLNAARLAAHGATVPVRLVDVPVRGFGVSCCVWAAGDAIAAGAGLDEAVASVEALAPQIDSVFVVGALQVVGALDLAGLRRIAPTMTSHVADAAGIAVLSFRDGDVQVIDRVASAGEAVAAMAALATGSGEGVRIAIGTADCAAAPLSDALRRAVIDAPNVAEVISYRVGPAASMHREPGTVECFMFPSSP